MLHVHTEYRDRPLAEMSRDELIAAVRELLHLEDERDLLVERLCNEIDRLHARANWLFPSPDWTDVIFAMLLFGALGAVIALLLQ